MDPSTVDFVVGDEVLCSVSSSAHEFASRFRPWVPVELPSGVKGRLHVCDIADEYTTDPWNALSEMKFPISCKIVSCEEIDDSEVTEEAARTKRFWVSLRSTHVSLYFLFFSSWVVKSDLPC